MSNRLNQKRESELQPIRMDIVKSELAKLDIELIHETDSYIQFMFNNAKVSFYPYSGWHSGKSIKDGRGLENLLKQLKSL